MSRVYTRALLPGGDVKHIKTPKSNMYMHSLRMMTTQPTCQASCVLPFCSGDVLAAVCFKLAISQSYVHCRRG